MNTVNVSLTSEELNALTALLDIAVKASGIQGIRPALAIIDKLEQSVKIANAAKEEPAS